MGSNAALADVTPAEVWGDWKTYMTGFGYEMTGSEAADGSTLTITDMAMSMPIPEEGVEISMSLGEISFVDNGDGTVSVQLPASVPLTLTIDPEYGENVNVNMNYNTSNYSMVVSGDATNMNYTYSADELALELADIVVDGEAVPLGTAMLSIANVAGTSDSMAGNLRNVKQALTTGAVKYDIKFSEPGGGSGKFILTGGTESLGFDGAGSFPAEMDMSNMAAILKAGFAFDGTYTFGPGSMEFLFSERDDTVQASSSSQGGSLSVAMDESKLSYGITSNGAQMNMSAPDIPLPIELALEEFGFNFLMPISAGEQEQDFGIKVLLGGLSTSEMLWSMVDMTGQLPHDPVTISVDLGGKARMFMDILDPESMAALESGMAMPGEVTALNLNELILSAVGAELTGNGAFTIDNTDMATFGGVPAPTGALDVKLVGANALLDKLVAMGLLPEDQAMGARMMSGMFMVPGDGEDTLMSKIEVNGDGSILANGQRIK
jgi:hypothetical protein